MNLSQVEPLSKPRNRRRRIVADEVQSGQIVISGKEGLMETHPEEDLLSDGLDRVADVARYLKISTAQVYVLMGRGELPYTTIGRCRRVPHRAVVQLAARNLV